MMPHSRGSWGLQREKGLLTVLAKMAEHRGGDYAVGVVPICPEPHKPTEPAATIQVAAGSVGNCASYQNCPVARAAQKNSRQGHGRPGGREVAGTGTEQPRFHSGKQGGTISCDAECDAISANLIELLTRTVILVAGMNLPEADRATVMSRLLAAVGKEAPRAGRDLDRAETLALDFLVDRVVCFCILASSSS